MAGTYGGSCMNIVLRKQEEEISQLPYDDQRR